MAEALWKRVRQLLKSLNIKLPFDLAIPLLGTYTPKEMKTCTRMCTNMYFFNSKNFENHNSIIGGMILIKDYAVIKKKTLKTT